MDFRQIQFVKNNMIKKNKTKIKFKAAISETKSNKYKKIMFLKKVKNKI